MIYMVRFPGYFLLFISLRGGNHSFSQFSTKSFAVCTHKKSQSHGAIGGL